MSDQNETSRDIVGADYGPDAVNEPNSYREDKGDDDPGLSSTIPAGTRPAGNTGTRRAPDAAAGIGQGACRATGTGPARSTDTAPHSAPARHWRRPARCRSPHHHGRLGGHGGEHKTGLVQPAVTRQDERHDDVAADRRRGQ